MGIENNKDYLMPKRIQLLPVIPIIIAPILLFSPLIFTGKALFWGTPSLQFVPWWAFAWETLLDGHLPLWNPLVGMGAPLIANYQSALFYPPYWLYFLSYVIGGLGLMAWAQSLLVVLHLIWAGLGMARLTRNLGLSTLAQTVCGLAFSLSGYLVARAWFASINAAVAWLPWVILFTGKAVRSGNKKDRLRLSVVIGLQLLAGHAQTTWYTLVLAALWAGYWRWQVQRTQTNLIKRVINLLLVEVRYGLTVLGGVALSAVQLLPTAVYLMQSQRASAVEMEFALNYSFWPWRLIGLLAPDFFGSPVRGDFWGYGNYWEDALYIGMLPVLLVIGVLVRNLFTRKSGRIDSQPTKEISNRRSLIWFLFTITGMAFLLALGKNTPIFPWLYRHVPTFDMFQAPTRISIWMVFSLTLLAGLGVDAWRPPRDRGLYWTRLGTAGAFAVTLGAGLAYFGMGDVSPSFIRATALAGLWGLGAGILSLTMPQVERKDRLHLWSSGVILWVMADLIVAGWGLNPGIEIGFYTHKAQSTPELVSMPGNGRLYLDPDDEENLKYERFLSFESFDTDIDWREMRSVQLANLNMLEGIPAVNNFDPFVPGRYRIWMDALSDLDDDQLSKALDLMGVGVLQIQDPDSEFGVRFEPRAGSNRIRWVPCAVYLADEETVWEQVFDEQYNPQSQIVIEHDDPAQIADCSNADGQVSLIDENPNQLVIDVDSTTSGWVMISDVWYPGWRAWIDGERTSVLRADYLFRAVANPSGSRRIVMAYQPVEFYLGAALSIVAWLVVAGLFISLPRTDE